MSAVLPISVDEAASLADEFESRSAEDVVRWTAERFGERAVLTCSWQKQSSVLVHMLSEVAPKLRVVEFDTGLLFPETYDTRERLIARYPIKFERIEPELTVEQQAAARAGAAGNGRLDHGNSPRAVDNSPNCTQDRGGRPSRRRQGAATCRLDKSRRVALYLEARHSVQHPA
jgi:3'-phosphoadenosine 5'-phosphosulfate sulfotransferase (PAPS reductase)/FAD synthetase